MSANPYLFAALSQSNAQLVKELKGVELFLIEGTVVAQLVAIKETLFMERRLTGDQQRDMAKVTAYVLEQLDPYRTTESEIVGAALAKDAGVPN